MMGAKVPLCPACVPPEGRPCLAVLPCVEHNVPTADVGWVLWGNAYLGTP